MELAKPLPCHVYGGEGFVSAVVSIVTTVRDTFILPKGA
jgi:hypothetical protein